MRTLIVLPHCDDESISCGGLIQRRLQEAEVFLFVVYGRVYQYGYVSVNQSAVEEKADFDSACAVLGVPLCNTRFLNFKEGEPAQVGYYKVLQHVEEILEKWRPDEVVGPANSDL